MTDQDLEVSFFFSEAVPKEGGKTIAIDFDGTLAEYNGYRGAGSLGEPLPGAINAVKLMAAAGHIIIIHTTRVSRRFEDATPNLVNIIHWLRRHGLSGCVADVTAEKPLADIYIDDRAIKFTDWKSVMEEIQ